MPVDKDDVGIGWTVQHEVALPETDSVPGQVFHTSQLPDAERQAVELGSSYPTLYANVGGQQAVYESREEAEAQPGGPEPGELDKQKAFNKPVEVALAEGEGDNNPEGVGNQFSVSQPATDLEPNPAAPKGEKVEKAEEKTEAKAEEKKDAAPKASASKASDKK